jgi:hypothetical protein
MKRQTKTPRPRSAKRPGVERARAGHRPADWIRTTEAVTLARVPGDTAVACAAFTSLDPAAQMELARELVHTRRAEITRAYADVISLSAGYRLRQTRAGARHVEPEVCISVVVKKKWKPGRRGPAGRRVPTHFFAYAALEGARTLCAVPTDVEDGQRLARLRPQAQIEATAAGTTARSAGVIACAITRPNDRNVYAVGCRHVFGMALVLDPSGHHAAKIMLAGGEVGEATPIAGALVNAPAESFDSQLAFVSDPDRLWLALDGVKPAGRAASWGDFRPGVDYWILTPAGPVRAHFAGLHEAPVPYSDELPAVLHFQLARFLLPDGPTFGGDSGAPVMTERTGGILLGMHIIGDLRDTSLAIPAWQLLDPVSYGLPHETWMFWAR